MPISAVLIFELFFSHKHFVDVLQQKVFSIDNPDIIKLKTYSGYDAKIQRLSIKEQINTEKI